ncbi:MAG: DNA mismatch repair endonuclease MutL [bacterium]
MSNRAEEKPRIRILSEEVFNRIAAGEVVDRPASLLKELIENSIDAGATAIEISVQGAGCKEIAVSDNGEGINPEDLLLAFERHATSKVSNLEDLISIRTLGFRGEALAAITAVSRIKAVSRLHGNLIGCQIRLHGGKTTEIEEVGAPEGTAIVINDLFFNTPARKKFLKSSGTENAHIVNVFKRYALSFPDIRWSLQVDNRELYRLPEELLNDRIVSVYGQELAKHLIAVQAIEHDYQLTGYIGSVQVARRSRGDQHIYVNQRWVQNRLLGHAVASAFGDLLQGGSFPFFVLFLTLPHAEVDVNVHPAKTEIKFQQESRIYSFLLNTIRATLQEAGLAATPTMKLQSGETLDPNTGEILTNRPSAESHSQTASVLSQPHSGDASAPWKLSGKNRISEEAYRLMFYQAAVESESTNGDAAEEPASQRQERTQVYQIHNRYILTEIKGGIAIIDQHAAHERILYEHALKNLSEERHLSQQLLFPKMIELDAEDAVRLREVLTDLQILGINIREFGDRSFVLEALPMGIREGASEGIVKEILDELKERGVAKKPGQEHVAAAFACRAAIKFGQSLSLREMNALIDQLFATKFPFNCPHGRPTLVKLTLQDLEHRFGRS